MIRLLEALAALKAYYRTQPRRRLRPDRSRLSSPGRRLLMTDLGPLDVLGAIGSGHGYEELSKRSVQIDAAGLRLRVLDLDSLIRIKEETAHAKDRATLEILRQTLKERSGR